MPAIIVRATALAIFCLLALVTGRTAFKAAYINYDYPFEFLVYAHGAPYPKALFNEIEELSLRTTGGTDMVVAYDNFVRYPYWWYMRRYTNKIDFDLNPTRDVRNALVIAAGDDKISKLDPIVAGQLLRIQLHAPVVANHGLLESEVGNHRSGTQRGSGSPTEPPAQTFPP